MPDKGDILFDEENIPHLSRKNLYRVRKKMRMLFQFRALFTDLNIFKNMTFALREHRGLSEELLRSTMMLKLEAVDLKEAAYLMPAELSGA